MIIQRELQDRLETWAMDDLGLKPSTKGFLRGDCPLCGKHNTFGINPEQNRINCFTCKPEGTAFQLYTKLNNFRSYGEALSGLREIKSFYLKPVARFKEPKLNSSGPKEPIKLPEGYTNILVGTSIMGQAARNYLKQRNYDIEDLALRGIGYCVSGEYLGYIIMSYYYDEKLVHFTSRQIVGDKHFKNPPEELFGIGKSELIYNKDSLYLYREINILESITNCLTLEDNSIAIGGKQISPTQLSLLIKAPVDIYNILLDPDAREEAYQLALTLSQYKSVRLIRWKDPEKDVNDFGRKVINYWIKKRPIKTYSQLLKDKINPNIP